MRVMGDSNPDLLGDSQVIPCHYTTPPELREKIGRERGGFEPRTLFNRQLLNHSVRSNPDPLLLLERMMRIELTFPAWKAGTLAIVLHPHCAPEGTRTPNPLVKSQLLSPYGSPFRATGAIASMSKNMIFSDRCCGGDRDRTDDLWIFSPALYAIAPSELLPQLVW